jgi:hypothetical protein
MNRKYISIITLALVAFAGGNAMAQSAGQVDAYAKAQQANSGSFSAKLSTKLSRETVQAELREAKRTGEFVENAEAGIFVNDMFPSRYPAQVVEHNMSPDILTVLKNSGSFE